jgi:hypothetical protein
VCASQCPARDKCEPGDRLFLQLHGAHFAQRLGPDELAAALVRAGFTSVRRNLPSEASQLQALGEDGMNVIALELLSVYRRLALRVKDPKLAPIVEGQGAQIEHLRVAGKTAAAHFPGLGSPASRRAGIRRCPWWRSWRGDRAARMRPP